MTNYHWTTVNDFSCHTHTYNLNASIQSIRKLLKCIELCPAEVEVPRYELIWIQFSHSWFGLVNNHLTIKVIHAHRLTHWICINLLSNLLSHTTTYTQTCPTFHLTMNNNINKTHTIMNTTEHICTLLFGGTHAGDRARTCKKYSN